MTPLFLALMLLQATPAPPPADPAPEPEATPAEKLAGLEQIYATTCGQTGILYHAYDDLCDGLRKQIHIYRDKVDRDEARARTAAAKPVSAPKPVAPAPQAADTPTPNPR